MRYMQAPRSSISLTEQERGLHRLGKGGGQKLGEAESQKGTEGHRTGGREFELEWVTLS